MNIKPPTEYQDGCVLAEYCQLKHYLFSHIPAETFTKSWGIKIKNKKQGVNKGVPDYIIIIGTKLVFIELKRIKGGVVSREQQEWIDRLKLCGVYANICKGADEAIKFLNEIEKL